MTKMKTYSGHLLMRHIDAAALEKQRAGGKPRASVPEQANPEQHVTRFDEDPVVMHAHGDDRSMYGVTMWGVFDNDDAPLALFFFEADAKAWIRDADGVPKVLPVKLARMGWTNPFPLTPTEP